MMSVSLRTSSRPLSPGSEGLPSSTQPVDWRGIAWFIALAFGLAWTIEGIALARGMRVDQLAIATTVVLTAVMFTPAIASVVVRRFVTVEGFASAGLRVGPRRFYLIAWLGVPLLVALIYGVTLAAGLGHIDPSLETLFSKMRAVAPDAPLPPARPLALAILVQSLTLGPLVTTLATFGEELGWTGFLLPKLLPLGKWRAALFYGVVWGLWHAPIIAAGFNYPGYPVLGVFMMCAFTCGVALIQTAARLRSNSVLLTSFIHAGINNQGMGLLPNLVVGVSPVIGGVTGLVGIAVFAITGTVLLRRTTE